MQIAVLPYNWYYLNMFQHKNIEDPGFSRRLFLKLVGLFGVCLAIPSRLYAFFLDHFPVRTIDNDDYTFNSVPGDIEWKDKGTEQYHLTITGLIEKTLKLSYKDLLTLPQVSQTSDFHCVEGWSVADLKWGGIRFVDISKKVKPKKDAKYAIFHSLGTTDFTPGGQTHYVESFPVSELLDPARQCLLALTLDGKPLTKEHGAPLRVISPFNLGYKNIKYVMAIEFSEHAQRGWWTCVNPEYSIDAPVPKSRLSSK
jgi:DMSO/TMAO reductase YedYZ molybdopterin-dependent catalytic subunit